MRARLLLVPLALSIGTGCEEIEDLIEGIEEIDRFRGGDARRRVVLPDADQGAAFGTNNNIWAGVDDVTCTFRTDNGDMRRDVDLARGREKVIDAHPDQDRVMLAGPEPKPALYTKPFEVDLVNEDTVAGAYTRDGMIRLVDSATSGCTLQFELETHTATALNGVACGWPSIAVDRATNTAWVADGTLEVHTADGSEVVGDADLVAIDPNIPAVYTAEGSVLTALTLDGDATWSVDTGRVIDAIAAMPSEGMVIAHTRSQTGQGTLISLSGRTGTVVQEQPVQEAFAAQLLVDGNSTTVAIDTGDNVIVYNNTAGPIQYPEDI